MAPLPVTHLLIDRACCGDSIVNIIHRFSRSAVLMTLPAALVFVAALTVPATVRAEDTEVFFPPQQTTTVVTNPNILFVIDTSGSMAQTDGQTDANGNPVNRLQRVQTAFTQVLATLGSNVNVGLMRYSALLGGPISFPVAPIDAYLDTVDTTGTGDRTVQQSITDSTSEAYQLTANPKTVTVAPATITLNSTNGNIGLRFDAIQIPRGVTVTGAQVTFYGTSGISTSGMPITIKAEQTGNAAAYTTAANNITGRTYTGTPTPPSVTWTLPTATYNNGDDFNTPELKDLINSVVSRSDWCGGNALALNFSTSSSRTLAVHGSRDTTTDQTANNTASALAPVLTLSFSPSDANLATGCNKAKVASQIGANSNDDSTETNENGNPNQPACKGLFLNTTPNPFPTYTVTTSGCGTKNKTTKVGLRFPKINIPQGTTIVSAVIDFTPLGTDTSTPTLTIKAENAITSSSFAATGSNTVGNRMTTPGTTGSVAWTTTAWSNTAPSVYTTPDLTSLVQGLVNNTSWDSANNALTFFITGSGSGTHAAYSSDGNLAYAPKLRIQLQGPAGRITVRKYLEQVVNGFVAQGGTPTMGVLYEAARYFRGEAAFYGRTRSFGETYVAGTSVRYPDSSGSNIQVDGSTDYSSTSRISHRGVFDYSRGTPTHNYPTNCSDFNLNSKSCDGESWTGTTVYKSPITDGCQSNNIVLLSDGLPNVTTSASNTTSTLTSVSSAAALIKSMTGNASCTIPRDSSNTTQTEWQCGTELTKFLFTNDQSTAFGGPQNIRTYTIAFSPSVAAGGSDAAGGEFLKNLANSGGGQSFAANSIQDVVNAFQSIVGNILSINTTFVAPSVTVNTYNRLTNRNELYFAVFRPDTDALWNGNLKKYQLYQANTDTEPQIYDSGTPPLPAVDSATGFFKDGTCSFWSVCTPAAPSGPGPDGSDIAKGGAASKLAGPSSYRTVYTYVGGSAPSNVDLTQTANVFNESNAAITTALLGMSTSATSTERTSLMKWARGIDVNDENGNGSTTDAKTSLGDPLHSEPLLITYGGTETNPDIAIFMGTNQDGFHAFSSRDGTEYFSFLPKESLANLNTFYNDIGSYLTRPAGVDGPITAWVNDGGDGVISGSDTAYVYFGMRRGGSSYYALNVTNRAAPKLMFQIAGGTGNFVEMGQTWSKAIHARIHVTAADAGRDVLIFTGGYDPSTDSQNGQAVGASNAGRALYVVDATTGAKLWWAGFDDSSRSVHPDLVVPQMTYSVPASPRVIDLDSDGYVDRIYIADTGGQIFRFILSKDATNGVRSLANANAQFIAKLSGTTVASAHRFYATPDASLIKTGVKTPFIALSIGSGFREHPLLQENEDRFYVLRDIETTNDAHTAANDTANNYTIPNIDSTHTSPYIAGDADLYDATANYAGTACATGDTACTSNKTAATTALGSSSNTGNKKGFYIKLVDASDGSLKGEKVLGDSLTFNRQVFFATFQPGVASTTCSAVAGLSRAYQFSVVDGTPTVDNTTTATGNDNSTSVLGRADRARSIKVGGLPPAPTIIIPSISSVVAQDGTRTVCTGSNCRTNDKPLVFYGAVKIDPGSTLSTYKTSWQKIEN
jgi:type IV pilus assembly protein PilY1